MPRPVCLLLLAAMLAAPAAAQERPSHRPVGGGLEGSEDPEDLLADRLRNKRLSDAAAKLLGQDIEKLARQLLADPELVESLRKNITREQIEAMKKRLEAGGLANDPNLRKLLQDPAVRERLTQDQRERVEKWAGTRPEGGPPDKAPVGPVPPTPPTPPPPMPAPPPPSEPAAMPGWMKERLSGWLKDAERWAGTQSGRSWRDMLERFARSRQAGSAAVSDVARSALGATRYLPRLSDYVPRNVTGNLPRVTLPPPPRLGSLPTPRSAADAGKGVLLGAVLAALAYFLWRAAGWYRERQARMAAEWRPGPWPFAPGSVSTREQVVRAFEHLALVLLGRGARTLSHREVAREIGRAPAAELAAAYEKARYAPPADEMSDDEIARARKALCDLAGAA